jgi:hypothetical protein
MRERRSPVCRGHGGVDIASDIARPSLRHAGLDEIQAADHAGEKIVEVVSDSAGQLAHCFHLLRLPQRFLGLHERLSGLLLGGDVASDRMDEVLVRHGRPGNPAVRPVPVAKPVLDAAGG